MPRENVELLCRGFDEMNRVGISNVNLLVYFHPDVEYWPRRSATEGAYRGIAGIRARGSGIETDIATAGVFDFSDGKIVRWEDFGDRDEALRAVGLAG